MTRAPASSAARKTKRAQAAGTQRPAAKPGRPLWAQVLEDLRARIASGEFDEGFATDFELMEHYGVSRHTVREAVRHLTGEGLLTRHKGRGSFVQPLALEQRVGPLYSLFDSIEEQGHIQRSEVLAQEITQNADVAQHLGLPRSTRLFYLRRVRRADGTPFAVDEIWLPAKVAGALATVDFAHTSVYGELERIGSARPARGWERIRPAKPTADERALLRLPASEAVFVVTRFTESVDGPLEWRSTVIRGDAYTFITTWTGESTTSRFDVQQPAETRASERVRKSAGQSADRRR